MISLFSPSTNWWWLCVNLTLLSSMENIINISVAVFLILLVCVIIIYRATTIKQTMIDGDHYSDVIISTTTSQITSLAILYSTVYSGADQRKHQSSPSLAFVRGIHRTGEFPAQRASNAENVPIWWRHHVWPISLRMLTHVYGFWNSV